MKSLVSIIVNGQQAGDTQHFIFSYMGGVYDTSESRGPKIISAAPHEKALVSSNRQYIGITLQNLKLSLVYLPKFYYTVTTTSLL